jgi:hypothetical protein
VHLKKNKEKFQLYNPFYIPQLSVTINKQNPETVHTFFRFTAPQVIEIIDKEFLYDQGIFKSLPIMAKGLEILEIRSQKFKRKLIEMIFIN